MTMACADTAAAAETKKLPPQVRAPADMTSSGFESSNPYWEAFQTAASCTARQLCWDQHVVVFPSETAHGTADPGAAAH